MGTVTNSDEEGIDIDVIVNFNPTANIVGSSATGGNASSGSESEIEIGDIEVESKSESDSKSKSKSTAEGGGGFDPGPNGGPPGQENGEKSEGALVKAVKKVLPKRKKKDDADD